MFYQEGEGRKARFSGQYGDRGGGEAIGDPSLDSSPEGIELVLHFEEGVKRSAPYRRIGAIREEASRWQR